MAEHRVYTAGVVGSIPAGPTHKTAGHRPAATPGRNPHIPASPQKVRKIRRGRPADDVETVRNVIQLVREQVPVEVERHARGVVPEHLLDDLHVGARGDGERRRGVPQTVRGEVRFTDADCDRREGAPSEVPVP